MLYPPAAIANRFLELAAAEGKQLTPMQIQKLVYFAHGWHLGFGRGPLSSESPQAWLYGPVFPSLYQAVKQWGGGPIQQPIRAPWVIDDAFARSLIERVWVVSGDKSAAQLSQMSHASDGPWKNARIASDGEHGAIISDEDTKRYFAKLSNDATG